MSGWDIERSGLMGMSFSPLAEKLMAIFVLLSIIAIAYVLARHLVREWRVKGRK